MQLINTPWPNEWNDWVQHPAGPQDTRDRFTNAARDQYSEELLTLVLDCLRAVPDTRPTFEEIKRRVAAKTGSPRKDAAVDMRDAAAGDQRFVDQPFQTRHVSDAALAMAHTDLMDVDPQPGGPTGTLIGAPP